MQELVTVITCLTIWVGLGAAFYFHAKQSKEKQLRRQVAKLKKRLSRYEVL